MYVSARLTKEATHRQPARSLHRHARKEKQHPLHKRPYRQRDRRIEIPRQIPMPKQVRPNRRSPIPTLVGELCPIEYPRRPIGKIRPQMPRMQRRESGNREPPTPLRPIAAACQPVLSAAPVRPRHTPAPDRCAPAPTANHPSIRPFDGVTAGIPAHSDSANKQCWFWNSPGWNV